MTNRNLTVVSFTVPFSDFRRPVNFHIVVNMSIIVVSGLLNIECGGLLVANNHVNEFYSHANYGDQNYDNRADCGWLLAAEHQRHRVRFRFQTFEIEAETECGSVDREKSVYYSLFTTTRYNPQHVLHQLLPPPKHTGCNLRSRGHGLTLSVIPSEYMRKNFVDRML